MSILGFDIGASSIKAVLTENGKISASVTHDLPKTLAGLLALMGKIKKDFESGISPRRINKTGVAIAGILDKKRSKVLVSPNIKYLNHKPLKRLLIRKLKCRDVLLEHDVHCFLLAEKLSGRARNMEDVFFLTIGSGIGGAWSAGGRIFYGHHGAAGEAGHMALDIDNGRDLEYLASNKFIKRNLGIGSRSALRSANLGNKKAQRVFYRLGFNLGVGIANIINIFDPETVILGGGIAGAKKWIMSGIQKGMKKFVVSPEAKKTKIKFAKFGLYGGALGAALLVSGK